MHNQSLPYSAIFIDLLNVVHKGLLYVYKNRKKGLITDEKDSDFIKIFDSFYKEFKKKNKHKHILKGLTVTQQDREHIYPRICKLIINSFDEIEQIHIENSKLKTKALPSPLKIIYNLLTVPEEPQTASYAYVLLRTNLFKLLNLHPFHKDLNNEDNPIDLFNENNIIDSLISLRNYKEQTARWPDGRIKKESVTTRIHYLNGHILGIKGVTYLWFSSEKNINSFLNSNFRDLDDLSDTYCDPNVFRFRVSNQFEELPDYSEIINWVFGIPIPIRGADVLFHGALKKSRSSGLVINLHGLPGAGKTTVALALSAVMSPLGTSTFYISLEEGVEDLKSKLTLLIPSYLKDLDIYSGTRNSVNGRNYSPEWFNPVRLDANLKINELTEILNLIQSEILNEDVDIDESYLPSVCPVLIVIDNVNELFIGLKNKKDYYQNLEDFIAQCRSMDAIVILIAADGIPSKFNLDYLVDVSIRLEQKGVFNRQEKPERILQLLKTRQQISRQGTHAFHLSSSKGFRISPQVPSQLDRKQVIRRLLPNKKKILHTLNITRSENKIVYNKFLDIQSRSQILVHGHGSSGKAGFGLKILLSPSIDGKISNSADLKKVKISQNSKVLIISFLYPKDYYKTLYKRIEKQLSDTYNFKGGKLVYNVLAFYAGYLSPEDFVYKIIRNLEQAKLEGEPYTGVLIDGLHNVFLQFKMLQESHMVWPLLYNILSRYNVTVVSTFTNFSIDNDSEDTVSLNPQDHQLQLEGQKPFLHGLVKAADYYFVLNQDFQKDQQVKYNLSIKAAIENPPTEKLQWNRQGIYFEK